MVETEISYIFLDDFECVCFSALHVFTCTRKDPITHTTTSERVFSRLFRSRRLSVDRCLRACHPDPQVQAIGFFVSSQNKAGGGGDLSLALLFDVVRLFNVYFL